MLDKYAASGMSAMMSLLHASFVTYNLKIHSAQSTYHPCSRPYYLHLGVRKKERARERERNNEVEREREREGRERDSECRERKIQFR